MPANFTLDISKKKGDILYRLISSYVIRNESMQIGAMCYVHAQLNPGCDGLQSTDIDTDSDVFPKLHTSKIQ